MEGVEGYGRTYRHPRTEVVCRPDGVTIRTDDGKNSELWFCHTITISALWELVNMCDGMVPVVLPPVPPMPPPPPDIDLADVLGPK